MLVVSIWSLFFHRTKERPYRLAQAFASMKARGYTVGVIALALAVFCLIADLGHPDRALYLFTHPHFTILTFGAYVLLVDLVVGLPLAVANLFHIAFFRGRMLRTLEIACALCSGAVALYTGFYLASMKSVPFWNTWSLPALFFLSSLSAGISIVLLIDYFSRDQTLILRAARPLQGVHIVGLACEAALLGIFVAATLTNPAAARSVAILATPAMLSTSIVGIVGMGLVAPFCFEIYALSYRECRTIPVIDVICLIGAACLRYVVVGCGVH